MADEMGVASEALCGGPEAEVHDLRLTPVRITPDGNGIFDETQIEAVVTVDRTRAAALLLRLGFLYELRWEVGVAAAGRRRPVAVRSWSENALLDASADPAEPLDLPVAVVWDGRDAAGVLVAAGEYQVTVTARLGLLPPGVRIWVPIGASRSAQDLATVAFAPDAQETALLEAEVIRERIGARPPGTATLDSTIVDPPYLYELADPADLRELSVAMMEVDGTTPGARFDALHAAMLADPTILAPPSAEMVAAWRGAFDASAGRLAVEWSPAGTPARMAGLDAGVQIGAGEEIAVAYVGLFTGTLRALFGASNAESWRLSEVTTTDDGAYSAARFEHLVEGVLLPGERPEDGAPDGAPDGPPEDGGQSLLLPVVGDYLAVHVRHVGLPAETGRVQDVTASWNRVSQPVVVHVSPAGAESIAVAATGFAQGEVLRTDGPFVVFPTAPERKVRYEVLVAQSDQQRRVVIDAATGVVEQVADGVQRFGARVVAPASPVAFPDEAADGPPWGGYRVHDRADWLTGVPYLKLTGADGRAVYTGRNGWFETTAVTWPVTVTGFVGQHFTEWHVEESTGLMFRPFSRTYASPSPTLHLAVGPVGDLGSADIGESRLAKDGLLAFLYAHFNYVREVYRRAGANTDAWANVKFFVEWWPRGATRCTQRSDCLKSWPGAPPGPFTPALQGLCDPATNRCTWDHYDFDDGDGNNTCDAVQMNTGDKDCDPPAGSDWNYMCDTSFVDDGDPATDDGWCTFSGGGPGAIRDNCYNFAQVRHVSGTGSCIGLGKMMMRCENEAGCADPTGWSPFLGPLPWAESWSVAVLTHETTHRAVGTSGWLARANQGAGRLAGFLSEALPDAVPVVVYDDLSLWEDRFDDVELPLHDPVHLAARFGGDPFAGPNDCTTVLESDDPGDSYECPENATTCAWQICAHRHPDCDAVGGGPCPRPGCDQPPDHPVRCDGGTAWIAADHHDNGTWVPALFSRYAGLVGRQAAMEGLVSWMSNPVDDNTVVASGTNSLYYKLAWSQGYAVTARRARARAYEAYRALRWTTTPGYRWMPEVSGRAISRYDDWTSTCYHGEIPVGSQWSFKVQRAGGSVGDINEDWDEHVLYMLAGETYEVRLAAGSATRRLYASVRTPPADPAAGFGTIEPLLAVTGSGRVTVHSTRSGYRYFAVGTDSGSPSVSYDLTLTLLHDDHGDQPADALLLPPTSDAGPIAGEVSGADVDAFRLFVHPDNRVRLTAEVVGTTLSSPAARLIVKRADGIVAWDRSFGTPLVGTRTTSVTLAPRAGPEFYDVTVQMASPSAAGTVRYLITTAPSSATSAPRLGCTSSVLAAGSVPAPQCTLGGTAPLLSGVLRSDADTDELWFYGREGRTYTVRLNAVDAVGRLHHPTALGTSSDAAVLFELTPSWQEVFQTGRGGPSVSFEAPLTGWYRLTVDGQPAGGGGEFGSPYPMPYTVQFAEGPVRMPDFPELLEWTGGPP